MSPRRTSQVGERAVAAAFFAVRAATYLRGAQRRVQTLKALAALRPITCQLCSTRDHEWCSGLAIPRNRSQRVPCRCARAGHPDIAVA